MAGLVTEAVDLTNGTAEIMIVLFEKIAHFVFVSTAYRHVPDELAVVEEQSLCVDT